MKRRITSALLIVAMLVLMLPTAAFASFSDINGHWAQAKIENWSEKGIIQGAGGQFRPNSPITRGEMAVILDRIMKYQVKAANTFYDLDQSWYTEAILKANAAGIILGSNNYVRPKDNITREEAVVILGRALGLNEITATKELKFKDASQISDWAVGYVNALTEKGFVKGDLNGNFNPKANITRAEVVTILDNSIKELYTKAGEYSDKVIEGNVIINTPSVTLRNMKINGDLIIAEGVGEGEVTLDNIEISGNAIVKGGGEQSVYFNSVTVGGALVVNKTDGKLRIVASGTTSVSVAVLESGAILVTRDLVGGGIEKVVIPASIAAGQNIVLQGDFKNVENNASDIKIEATGKIENLVLNAKTTVTGEVEVKNLTTAEGADSVINDQTVEGGQNKVDLSTPASDKDSSGKGKSSGGSGGGSGSGSGSNPGSSDEGGGSTPGGSDEGGGSQPGDDESGSSQPGDDEGGSSEPGDDDDICLVTFDTNGGTVIDAVYVKRGERLQLPAEPTKEGADFIGWYIDEELTQKFDPSTPITSDITLYARWSGWQEPVKVDPRFAEGYPKASVDPSSSTIELKIKLVGASVENPMDVYMIVNQINSNWNAVDIDAVLHGHAGTNDRIIQVDKAPFIRIMDEEEHVIPTYLNSAGDKSTKIYFVIKDSSMISETPTMLEFTKEVLAELDSRPPYLMSAYINKTRNKISLHFSEKLNTKSIPDPTDFTLTTRSDSGSVVSVVYEVYSVDVANNDWYGAGRVDLMLSGALDEDDVKNLRISYDGTALEDNATVPNRVESITNQEVLTAVISDVRVDVSHNGQYIALYLNRSPYIEKNASFNFTLKYGADSLSAEDVDFEESWSVYHNGKGMEVKFKVKNLPELVDGHKYFISFDPNGLKDFAGDDIPVLDAEGEPAETAEDAVKPTAVYDQSENKVLLRFPEDSGLKSDTISFCFFTIRVNDQDYILRGHGYFNGNTIKLDMDNIPLDPDSIDWERDNVSISYSLDVHPNAGISNHLTFTSGAPYLGFTDVKIEAQ